MSDHRCEHPGGEPRHPNAAIEAAKVRNRSHENSAFRIATKPSPPPWKRDFPLGRATKRFDGQRNSYKSEGNRLTPFPMITFSKAAVLQKMRETGLWIQWHHARPYTASRMTRARSASYGQSLSRSARPGLCIEAVLMCDRRASCKASPRRSGCASTIEPDDWHMAPAMQEALPQTKPDIYTKRTPPSPRRHARACPENTCWMNPKGLTAHPSRNHQPRFSGRFAYPRMTPLMLIALATSLVEAGVPAQAGIRSALKARSPHAPAIPSFQLRASALARAMATVRPRIA